MGLYRHRPGHTALYSLLPPSSNRPLYLGFYHHIIGRAGAGTCLKSVIGHIREARVGLEGESPPGSRIKAFTILLSYF